MLNPANGEPGHVVKYVGEYLDLVESLPFDLQRNVSNMKEIDAKYQGIPLRCACCQSWYLCFYLVYFVLIYLCMYFLDVLKELDEAYEKYCRETDSVQRRKLQLSIQRTLIRSQELGDEKIQIAGQMVCRYIINKYIIYN